MGGLTCVDSVLCMAAVVGVIKRQFRAGRS